MTESEQNKEWEIFSGKGEVRKTQAVALERPGYT